MYIWQRVKGLRLQGKSIKKIARELKLSKNTVRKYLRSEGSPEFHKREYKKLAEQYQEQIEEMLRKEYIGTRIFNEIKLLGYTGSLSALHRHLKKLKGDVDIADKVTTRFETGPGKQMQYDWKEWYLLINDIKTRIYIHELILSYSRKKYYTCSLGITTADITRAISAGIDYFGGFAEELVIDNPKQMIIVHHKDEVIRYNDEFVKFLGIYGIISNPCQNYRARTKGKVERPFYYLQEHLLRGLEIKEFAELDEKISAFNQHVNERIHSELKESADTRFKKEKDFLKTIPQIEPTSLFKREMRKVSADGYISWDGRLYPVPMSYCCQTVSIEKILGRELIIYNLKNEKIAGFVKRLQGDYRPEHPEHEKLNNEFTEKKRQYRAGNIKKFVTLFPDLGEIYIQGLKEEVRENLYWHMDEIMRYVNFYSLADVTQTLAECIKIKAFHKNSVKRILNTKKTIAPVLHEKIVQMLPTLPIKRSLAEYREVAFHG